jgi:hypothetical protein
MDEEPADYFEAKSTLRAAGIEKTLEFHERKRMNLEEARDR